MRVRFRTIRANAMRTCESPLEDAADFATRIGRDHLISITQAEGPGGAAVTVWYWEEDLVEHEHHRHREEKSHHS